VARSEVFLGVAPQNFIGEIRFEFVAQPAVSREESFSVKVFEGWVITLCWVIELVISCTRD
jgi:hypothetical protein